MSHGGGLSLAVGNLPSNRLAYTNRVYLSPNVYNALAKTLASNPEQDSSSQSNSILIKVGSSHVYTAEGHPKVPDDQITMNGLQRRFAQYSLATPVKIKPFIPPPNFALATLDVSVDLLSKKAVGTSKQPKEIDSNRLANDFLNAYEGQIFEVGRVLAMDFEGTKIELTIKEVGQINLKGGDGEPEGKEEDVISKSSSSKKNMGQLLAPTDITFTKEKGSTTNIVLTGDKISGSSGGSQNIFLSDFDFVKLGIGGLDEEFNEIFRRAFASRIWPSHIIKQMGINHVRGMLLYGPPGCGKTLIARQIGKVLNAREPKIVNGPEILNKYVGGSEEKIRELFAEAEQEQLEAGDHSMLHIVIMDEMDAICKQRGSVRDGTGVSDSVVNQLLSKIDGVDSLNNILLIGMTNRRDMIDDALLRPGRLEVHVEIGLPDVSGRLQILNIHTKSMKEANRINPEVLSKMDILADKTKNFSGAEIEGLVKAATSFALTRCVDVKDLSKPPDESKLILQYNDFVQALNDIEPKFGAKSQELKALYRNGFVPYGESFDYLISSMERLVEQVRSSSKTPLMSVLLRGPSASGKTALAAKIAVDSNYPFIRMISSDEMIGMSENMKCQTIHKAFLDSYKSPLSIIFIDDIERIIEYVPIGPRFSNTILQTLLVLLKKIPPGDEGRRLLVIGTTSCPHLLEDIGLVSAFGVQQSINLLDEPEQICEVLRVAAHMSENDANDIAKAITKPIGIKQLLMVAEMAKQGSSTSTTSKDSGGANNAVDVNIFMECLHTVGY